MAHYDKYVVGVAMKQVWAKLKARKQLIDAFKHAKIYHKVKIDEDTYRYIYPSIKSVTISDHHTKYSFSLPTGIDPDLLSDKLFVFKQVFGQHVEINGEIKRFTLAIHRRGMPAKVPFVLEEWAPVIKRKVLPVVCGKDVNGRLVAYDMAEQPHLLISGETGSGKSSLLRAALTTLALTKQPDQLRLVLGDLKRSEFGLFRNLPHVDGVHVSPGSLRQALKEIEREMKHRGDLLDEHECTHISELPDRMPYIVVAIDEVALLRQEKDIMAVIEDISSIGRSLGVLLMLSMQRPDHKVLEGRLKNNLTVRISGRQSNARNSEVAGTPGAHEIKLSEKGRMILVLEDVVTVQAPLLEYPEAKELLAPIKVKPAPKVEPSNEFQFGILEGDVL